MRIEDVQLTPRRLASFWEKVCRGEDCWGWLGALNHGGYGVFGGGNKPSGMPQIRAHRLMYMLKVGPIPAQHVVMHSCDNPNCVNPDHLSVGTQADNMRDMSSKRRRSGELNPRAKLTLDDVAAIRLARGKRTQRALAKEYGVCSATICNIQTRQTWN